MTVTLCGDGVVRAWTGVSALVFLGTCFAVLFGGSRFVIPKTAA